MFKRVLFFVVVTSLAMPAWAINILTSIKPIQMITYELTQGIDDPDVLLPSSASPHDYALRPSDILKIRQADMIIWFGPELEPFMAPLVKNHAHVLTISQIPHLPLQTFQEEADNNEHDDHDHDSADDTHHHHAGSVNPHFWLGVNVVRDVARAISAQLIALDSENTERYQHNLATFLIHLNKTDRAIQHQLSPYQDRPYFVFHDAYGYFESYYHLYNLGHFTVSPERKPGAKTIAHIHETLAHYPKTCIFAEPQFQPAILQTVIRGTDATLGELDPLGTRIPVDAGSYFRFLRDLAQRFSLCLAQE